jgi:hypothetical protein
MKENKNADRRVRGVTLRNPHDVQRICKRLIDGAFRDGSELELMGRITNALNTFLKAWELEELETLKERLEKLEKSQQERK